jgi:lipoprotein-anchoring transpeptidase ErfK/SrfK
MSLPSQYARPIARRSHMHRSRRGRLPWKIIVGAAAAVGIAGWWWIGSGDEPAPAGLVTGVGTLDEDVDADLGLSPEASAPKKETTVDPADRAATPPKTAVPQERRTAKVEPQDPTPPPTRPPAAPAKEERKAPARTEVPVLTRAARSDTPTPDTATGTAGTDSAPRGSARRASRRVQAGLDLLARNQLVDGRRLLSQTLAGGDLGPADAAMVRSRLAELNERLVFSPEVAPDDPFILTYRVQDNDALSKIPRRLGVQVDWRFVAHINRISDPRRIHPGQNLKVVTGPFHAVVHKSDYRLDLYLGDEGERVYVRSFDVGLGEYNSTPEGRFRVRPDSKLENPEWRNPRTRELFAADDPMNPIGEYWVGLVGDQPGLENIHGYGIHGTIEPDSIGRQASMGCVRMRPDDVKLVWSVLMDEISTVEIRP